MYEFRRKATQKVITLSRLAIPPTMDEIAYMHSRSKEARGRFIELPWTFGTPPFSYYLTVRHVPPSPPAWTMYRGEGEDAQVAWSFAGADLGLIHNMVLMECERQEAAAAGQAAGKASASEIETEDGQEATPEALRQLVDRVRFGTSVTVPPTPQPAPGEAVEPWQEPVSRQEEEEEEADFHLEGNLKNISVGNICRYIHNTRLSGRLSLEGKYGAAEIYFATGNPRHVSTMETKGVHAFLELFSWEEGEYQFAQGEKTSLITIEKPFEELLGEAEALLSQERYLRDLGLTQDSYLLRQDDLLSEESFASRLPELQPWQLTQHRRFYGAIDGTHTLLDLLRKFPAVRSEWVPIMYNLLHGKLVEIASEPKAMYDAMQLVPVEIDQDQVEQALSPLVRRSTGIYQYAAFQHFLLHEYYRYERTGGRFCVVAFEMGVKPIGAPETTDPEVLSNEEIQKLCAYIKGQMRKTDILAHFEMLDFILLLPDTDSAGGSVFANRLYDSLTQQKESLIKRAGQRFAINFGVASLPDDCRQPGLLLSAAREAKCRARTKADPKVLLFAEVVREITD